MVKEEKCREMKSKSLNHHVKMQVLDMNTPYKTLLMKLDEKKNGTSYHKDVKSIMTEKIK